jgi:hypothetical protein
LRVFDKANWQTGRRAAEVKVSGLGQHIRGQLWVRAAAVGPDGLAGVIVRVGDVKLLALVVVHQARTHTIHGQSATAAAMCLTFGRTPVRVRRHRTFTDTDLEFAVARG